VDSRINIIFLLIIFLSCNELSCRFNNVPDPPFPDPDNIENFKNNLINQVTYVYECLDKDIYNKQFVAFTYTVERESAPSAQRNISCWKESVYVTLGNCL
tara:strand:+ start:532 stop:831 length:300 start_codon:yes stop_codon:yes gene_type:complete